MNDKRNIAQCGTGGLGSDPGDVGEIVAPGRGPKDLMSAPCSSGMFDRMHGAGPAPPDDGIEDRAAGTETLEAVLTEVMREGDPMSAGIYAQHLVKHIRAHGYETPDHRAMSAAITRRAARLEMPRGNDALWEQILREAAREVGLRRDVGDELSLVDAILIVEPLS